MTFIPVERIDNFRIHPAVVPLQAAVGQEVELLADVFPANATNRTIDWSLISGDITFRRSGTRTWITSNASQLIRLRATIRNGRQQ